MVGDDATEVLDNEDAGDNAQAVRLRSLYF